MQSSNVTPDIADNVFEYFSREITPAYAITVCRRLRRVWNVGYRKGLVTGNPFAKMGLTNEKTRDVRWSEEQVNKAIETADECNKESIGTAITLMYHLCHHPVDIRQMRWGDIVDGKIKFTRQKTGAKLDIPLAPPIVERLEKVMPPSARLDDFIIKNEFDGRPYTTSVIQRHFRKVRLHANLPFELKLGDLRASGATEMADSGATNSEMRSVTGHKTLDVLALYARPTDTQAGNAINKRYATK
jgi:integrase